MSFIGSLDILGVRFRVMSTDPSMWPELQWGLCDVPHATITLCADMVGGITRSTLLHEVVHAVGAQLGLGLTEAQVDGVATGLATIPQLLIEPDPFPVQ